MAKRLSLTTPLATLAEIEAAIWSELEDAPQLRGHAWRQPVLATVDGTRADARTVILREVDRSARTLGFYCDARSAKVQQIAASPLGTLVLWAAPLGWQLRLQVRLQAESSGLAVASRWARLAMTPAAGDYLSPLPPGSTVPAEPRSTLPAEPPARESRVYFALVTAAIESIDWLELHADGHRRALFDAAGGRFVTP